MIEANGLRIYTMSELMQYLDCPAKYQWGYEERLEPRSMGAIPLNVGSAIHHGIQRMLQGSASWVQDGVDLYMAETGQWWSAVEEYGRDWQALIRGLEQVRRSLASYPWGPDDFPNVELIEESFVVEMGQGRAYSGQWDRTVRPKGLYVHDTKTTSERIAHVVQKQRLRMQYKAYCYAYEKVKGERPEGFIKDFIVKPRVNFKRTGELSSVGDPEYAREPMVVRGWDYEYFPQWFHRVVSAIEADRSDVEAGDAAAFPMNTEACGKWNRLCSFYELCRAVPKMRPGLRAGLFTEKEELHGAEYLRDAEEDE